MSWLGWGGSSVSDFGETRFPRAGSRALMAGAVFVLVLWFYVGLVTPGHGWGDDFALYINQARGLINGDPERVVADTRFAVDFSGSHGFSPYAYPWGFPIMLMPALLVHDMDYSLMKLVPLACLAGFCAVFFVLCRRRTGALVAALIVAAFALSEMYRVWANNVNSDFPSLLFVGLGLLLIERCDRKGWLNGASRRDLVVLGVTVGWAFSVRRETIALVAALGACQLVEVVKWWRRRRRPIFGRLATPYLAAMGVVLFLQLALPSSLATNSGDAALKNIPPNVRWYVEQLYTFIGLRYYRKSEGHLGGPGSDPWGLLILLALALAGALLSLWFRRRRDLHLIVFLLVTWYIVFTQPFTESRYLYSTYPLLLYFISQAFLAYRARRQVGKIAGWVGAVTLMGCLVAMHVRPAVDARRYYGGFTDPTEGPEKPETLELFRVVKQCTRPNDIVLFGQSRTMNLYTGRKSIQAGNPEYAVRTADWLALANDDVNYWEPPIDDTNAAQYHVTKMWSNERWGLWRVHHDTTDLVPTCEGN